MLNVCFLNSFQFLQFENRILQCAACVFHILLWYNTVQIYKYFIDKKYSFMSLYAVCYRISRDAQLIIRCALSCLMTGCNWSTLIRYLLWIIVSIHNSLVIYCSKLLFCRHCALLCSSHLLKLLHCTHNINFVTFSFLLQLPYFIVLILAMICVILISCVIVKMCNGYS